MGSRPLRLLLAVLILAGALAVGNPSSAVASDDLAVLEGPQVGCRVGVACQDVHVEINRATGQFIVRKGFAISCRGVGDPQPDGIRLAARCDNLNAEIIGGVMIKQESTGVVTFRMWKRNATYLRVIRASLSPVAPS